MEPEIYNNKMYKLREYVKQHILCHDIYNLSQIEERIENGDLPYFSCDTLERNLNGQNKAFLKIVIRNRHITKKKWLCVFKNPKNPLLQSFIQSLEKLHWDNLSKIEEAFPLLVLHQDKINWHNLSINSNPNILAILEKNLDKIDWFFFGWNLNIYQPNYCAIEKRMNLYKEELLQKIFYISMDYVI